jgi:hypothetical protein
VKQKQKIVLPLICISLFVTMAALGWSKLEYGFNMIDEGMYMVDGWRLAVGDNLFPDSAINAIQLFNVFNALIFAFNPDITLLGFREMAYTLTLLSLMLLGTAIYRWERKLWPLPLILSLFVFTGLDTQGKVDNLSYHTYPHLFLVIFVALLLLALVTQLKWLRNMLFIFSGAALWGIGFSFLPLVPTLISPLLIWLTLRYFKPATVKMTTLELLLLMLPGIVLWFLFLLAYHQTFIDTLLNIYRYVKEGGVVDKGKGPVWQYLMVMSLLTAGLVYSWRLPMRIFSLIIVIAAISVYFIIDTNLFGIVGSYWYGWFSVPMWLSATLMVGSAAAVISLLRQRHKAEPSSSATLAIIVLIPSLILALLLSYFSTIGALSMTMVAIPVVMALAWYILHQLLNRVTETAAASLLAAVLAPFYAQVALADWRFTYFDAAPNQLTHTIPDGFARGIKTNEIYAALVKWMQLTASSNSTDSDLAIVFDHTPMGYMLTKRRPALNHSWIGWAASPSLRREAMNDAITRNRLPKIAYRFVMLPVFIPISLKEGTVKTGVAMHFAPDDPISAYVTSHMRLVDTFSVNGLLWAEFYVQQAN